jgi:ribose 5-phosphate isomerase A
MNKNDSSYNAKLAAAQHAVRYVQDGMTLGLGTGSTAEIAIVKLAERVTLQKLNIFCIPTSKRTQEFAAAHGLNIAEIAEDTEIDLTIDGADEVSPDLSLIKGMGGALLWEKIVAKMSRKLYIVVDTTKIVKYLGEKNPVPVEVVQYGWKKTKRMIEASFRCSAQLRTRDGKIFVTDSGNYILDCKFEKIDAPSELERRFREITGVVETGLFCGLAKKIIVGNTDGSIREIDANDVHL